MREKFILGLRGASLAAALWCVTSAGVGAGAAPGSPTDVPVNHWAYQAVRTLVSKGYLPLGSDGAFKGDQPVDRFTLASVVAQLLAEVESGRTQVSSVDSTLLRRLEDEFRADLVRTNQQLARTDETTKATQRQVDVLDEKITVLLSDSDALKKALSDLKAQAARLERDASALKTGIAEAKAEATAEGRAGDAALSSRLDALASRLETDLASVRESLRTLDAQSQKRANDLDERLRAGDAAVTQRLLGELKSVQEQTSRVQEQTNRIGKEQETITQRLAALETAANELNRYADRIQSRAGELGAVLALTQDENEAARKELADRLASLEGSTQKLAADLSDLMVKWQGSEGRLSAQESQAQEHLSRLEQQGNYAQSLEQRLREQGQQLNMVVERLDALLAALEGANATIASLQGDIAALRKDHEAVAGEVQAIKSEFAVLRSKLGLSEEQLANVSQRLEQNMYDQLNLALLRQEQLSRQIKDLETEFAAYKQATEQKLTEAKRATNLATGAAVGGLVLGLFGLINQP